MKESSIVAAIMRYLREQPDCYAYKNHGTMYSVAGRPDIQGNVGPFALYLEVKRPRGGRVSRRQRVEHEKIAKTGALCSVVRSIEDVELIVNELRELKTARGG
jgi:hypothetical protein